MVFCSTIRVEKAASRFPNTQLRLQTPPIFLFIKNRSSIDQLVIQMFCVTKDFVRRVDDDFISFRGVKIDHFNNLHQQT